MAGAALARGTACTAAKARVERVMRMELKCIVDGREGLDLGKICRFGSCEG
jgi:hypothetical protein